MKKWIAYMLCAVFVLNCSGCVPQTPEEEPTPKTEQIKEDFALPDDIRVDAQGVPMLRVYIADQKEIEEMNIEEYLCGVLAGEMNNTWPEEALKAQAILARTFVVRFISEKQSKYTGADISTDIEEAQAYDAAGINDSILQAVNSTRGQIVCYQGEPIYAWFHAHSGGKTATAAEGLSYQEEAPYTQSVASEESADARKEDAEWKASFTETQVVAAAAEAGTSVGDSIESVAAGEKGESGRLRTIDINGKRVPANEFRIALGSKDMKSTLVTELDYADGVLTMTGKGYGHGVGMSQWGAYEMAKNGEKAEMIVNKYFKNVDIVQMWK